jgi:hypothetical protein
MARLAILLALGVTGLAAAKRTKEDAALAPKDSAQALGPRRLTGLSDQAREDGEAFCERSDSSQDKATCDKYDCCLWNYHKKGVCGYDLGGGPGGSNPVCEAAPDPVKDGEKFCERSDWSKDKKMCKKYDCCDWNDSHKDCAYDEGGASGGANPVCDMGKVNRETCADYKVDDEEWMYYAGDNGRKGCGWVAKNPKSRCSRIGDGLIPAKDACCAACKDYYECDFDHKDGTCKEIPEKKQCEDDSDWRYWADYKEYQGCDHIRRGTTEEQRKRCPRTSDSGVSGNEACPLTCNTCDEEIASLVAVGGAAGAANPVAKFAALTAAVALTALAAMAGAKKAKRGDSKDVTAKTPLINAEEPYQTPLYTL